MNTSGSDLDCQTCHVFKNHRVIGKGSDLRPTDDLARGSEVSCLTCHTDKDTSAGHATTRINDHVARVACQTCHIPVYAKVATEIHRDWRLHHDGSQADESAVAGHPYTDKQSDLIPVYAFWNRSLFEFLCAGAAALAARDGAAMERTVRRTAELHVEHIGSGGDPFEFGSARPLDFGHWSAHRLESMSGYELGHGQAVAVGIALDSFYAMRRGLLAADEFERILSGLSAAGLPLWDDLLARRDAAGRLEILRGIEEFREHLGGLLTVTLPRGIGAKVEVHEMDSAVIEEGIGYLRKRAG